MDHEDTLPPSSIPNIQHISFIQSNLPVNSVQHLAMYNKRILQQGICNTTDPCRVRWRMSPNCAVTLEASDTSLRGHGKDWLQQVVEAMNQEEYLMHL